MLLLDEPTNNLDLDSIRWLEDFLVRYQGCLIVISHDRHFLNAVCTHIADIDYETIITYTGGYDDMVLPRPRCVSASSREREREKKIAQLKEFVARFGAGTRASQVQSRKKRSRTCSRPIWPVEHRAAVHPLRMKRPSGKPAARSRGAVEGWPDLEVFHDFTASIIGGEKVAIIGRNGVGKTTLLSVLVERASPDAGTVEVGPRSLGRLLRARSPRSIPERLHHARILHASTNAPTQEELRGLLGKMLFKGEEGQKPTARFRAARRALLFAS